MSRFEKVVLDGENWHAGMTRLRSNGNLKYEKSYRDDCIRDDELADVVYLRSGDRERAFGVITNRRANYWTLGESDCINEKDIPPPEHTSNPTFNNILQNYGFVFPASGDNRLRIRNMILAKEYKIKYYNPYDLVNSIKEETRWGPQLTLEYPDMGKLDSLDLILFEVFPIGEDFKNKYNDLTDPDDSLIRKPKKEKEDEVKVYPNPNGGSFIVLLENTENVKFIQMTDNLGKIIDIRYEVDNKNSYDNLNFKAGVYSLKIVFEDRVIRKKVIIK